MNVKSLKKQLVAAIAMVLVAAIALGSSTYAWFAANTQVTASQTSISAKSDVPFLLISNAESGAYSTSTTITATATNLMLTTPLNIVSNVDYYADAAAETSDTKTTPTKATTPATVLWGTTYSDVVNDAKTAKTPVLVTSGNVGSYVLTTHVYIKTSDNTTAKNLKMDAANVTVGDNTIKNAYRIIAMTSDGKYQIYNNRTQQVTGDTALVADVNSTTVNEITLYVFFDGTDEDAKTALATNLSAITSVLSFSVDKNV